MPPARSYAAIVGGLCTIIGTSTNLIVRGLATNDFKDLKFGFFEIGARLGFPAMGRLPAMQPRMSPSNRMAQADNAVI